MRVECWTADPPVEDDLPRGGRAVGRTAARGPGRHPRALGGGLAGGRSARSRARTPAGCAWPTVSWPPSSTPRSRERMFPGVQLGVTHPPQGYVAAFELDAPLIDMSRYLEYLQERLQHAGAAVVRRRVDSLAEPAAHAPVIVNCTGLGARELAGDSSMEPVRGQHVVVENPGLEDFFMEDRGPPRMGLLVSPRRAGRARGRGAARRLRSGSGPRGLCGHPRALRRAGAAAGRCAGARGAGGAATRSGRRSASRPSCCTAPDACTTTVTAAAASASPGAAPAMSARLLRR